MFVGLRGGCRENEAALSNPLGGDRRPAAPSRARRRGPPGGGDACYTQCMMTDSKALAGWLPGHDARWVIATVLAVAGLLWVNLGNRIDDLSRRLDDLSRQMTELRTDLRRLDDRLRAVEIAVARSVPTSDEGRQVPRGLPWVSVHDARTTCRTAFHSSRQRFPQSEIAPPAVSLPGSRS